MLESCELEAVLELTALAVLALLAKSELESLAEALVACFCARMMFFRFSTLSFIESRLKNSSNLGLAKYYDRTGNLD